MSNDDSAANNVYGAAMLNASDRLNFKNLAHEDAAGAFLKDARLSQGIDIATLAGLLKVPVHKLQALEQSRFDVLPDLVFTRALASSMCRLLKLDPAPVLHQLPAITNLKVMPQNRGINTPFRTRRGRHAAPAWSHVSRPAIWFGLALLTGALVLTLLPFIEQEFAQLWKVGQLDSNSAQFVPLAALATTVVTPVLRNDGTAAWTQALAPGNSIPVEIAVAVPGPETLPTPPSLANTGAATLEPLITFKAKGLSSVKVTDGMGAVVLSRVLRAGESAGLSGTLPLSIVVGHASAIQVRVRGENFDLGVVSKNNIARFEVKQ